MRRAADRHIEHGLSLDALMRLLVTRPEPDAQRTAAALRARHHEVLIAPLFEVEATNVDFGPPRWDAVVMTSVNAARALCLHPRIGEVLRLPLFAVGLHTAEAARSVGFAHTESAEGNAADLVALLARRFAPQARLLYLAGRDRASDLATELGRTGIEVTTAELYRANALDRFPAAAEAALRTGAMEGVLHFSRRSAQIFVNCAERAGLLESAFRLRHFCISPRAAEPLQSRGVAIEVAAFPEEEALLELLA